MILPFPCFLGAVLNYLEETLYRVLKVQQIKYLLFWEKLSRATYLITLGTGRKVSARVGRSDLGWAMENILVVRMGHQFFWEYLVGSPINKIKSLSVKKKLTVKNKNYYKAANMSSNIY